MHDQWYDRITSVLSRYPGVVRAVLFGSRAKGTARDGSDIDLALEGEDLDEETVGHIRNALDDLLLPVSVDIVRITSTMKPARSNPAASRERPSAPGSPLPEEDIFEKPMHQARSQSGVPIRLTPERWEHISQNHPEMAGYRLWSRCSSATRSGPTQPDVDRPALPGGTRVCH